jgi:hypothetical protein
MTLTPIRCTDCGCKQVDGSRTYTLKDGEQRMIEFIPIKPLVAMV